MVETLTPFSSKSSSPQILVEQDLSDLLHINEPLGFAGGDENLYRYVKNSPTNATDPSGRDIKDLIWKDSVVNGSAELFGTEGFTMDVKQILSDPTKQIKSAIIGTQSWQTNDIKMIALICKDHKVDWDNKHLTRLDVHNINGLLPVEFTDKVSAKYDPGDADVAFLVIMMDRKLGLRPYEIDSNNNIKFPPEAILPVGNNYDASPAQWTLATQRMKEPYLDSKVIYVSLDVEVARRFPIEEQNKAAKIFKEIWGSSTAGWADASLLKYNGQIVQFSVEGGHSSVHPNPL